MLVLPDDCIGLIRTRPLSTEMLLYAREDTHYLLYVYDRMKNQVIEASEVSYTSNRYMNSNAVFSVYDLSPFSGIKWMCPTPLRPKWEARDLQP